MGARRSSHFPLRVRCFLAMSHTNRLDLIAAIHNHNLRGYGLLLAMETVLRQIDFCGSQSSCERRRSALESIGWYSECAKKLSKHRRDIIDVILSAQRSDKEDGAISAADTSWAIVRVIVLALEGNMPEREASKSSRPSPRSVSLAPCFCNRAQCSRI